jgi:hypothetical protein
MSARISATWGFSIFAGPKVRILKETTFTVSRGGFEAPPDLQQGNKKKARQQKNTRQRKNAALLCLERPVFIQNSPLRGSALPEYPYAAAFLEACALAFRINLCRNLSISQNGKKDKRRFPGLAKMWV